MNSIRKTPYKLASTRMVTWIWKSLLESCVQCANVCVPVIGFEFVASGFEDKQQFIPYLLESLSSREHVLFCNGWNIFCLWVEETYYPLDKIIRSLNSRGQDILRSPCNLKPFLLLQWLRIKIVVILPVLAEFKHIKLCCVKRWVFVHYLFIYLFIFLLTKSLSGLVRLFFERSKCHIKSADSDSAVFVRNLKFGATKHKKHKY